MLGPLAKLREAKYRQIIEAAFAEQGLPPEWGMAFARQESAFRPGALAVTGGDAKRGGAYGLFQVTRLTARMMGFDGAPEELFEPEINARWAAKLVRQLSDRFKGNLPDIAAAYNSGRPFDRAPEITRLKYVPAILRGVALYSKGEESHGQSVLAANQRQID